MIVRTPDRPIYAEDLEPGSLITIRISKDKIQEFIVLGFFDQDKTRLFVEALQIVNAETKRPYTYYLYANKCVLLTRIKRYPLDAVETVRARLSSDIVDIILQKAKVIKQKTEEQKQKRAERREKSKQHKHEKKLAAKKARSYKDMSSPKDSTNTAWKSLKYASEGYIHIYRG
ncbi:MAG: hypothetical protein IKZ98_02320 [Clostridia bacterium]|nr:hypothetical protein [Clostridia bacterium]